MDVVKFGTSLRAGRRVGINRVHLRYADRD
jgi:hypothetical protein